MSDFFAKQNEELQKKAQQQVDNAADELGSSAPIGFAGNYLCEVSTFAYNEKKGEKNFRTSPELFISTKKGSLNLNINLKVIDGTSKVPKYSSIYKNVTLCPGSVNGENPTDDTIARVMRFTKPLIVTLTGNNKIELTEAWIKEWLLAEFEEINNSGKFKVTRDHKMKNRVMCLVDQQLGTDNVVRLAVKNIVKALPGDKSETFLIPAAQPIGTTPAPTGDYSNLVEADDSEVPAHVPEIEEFN
jgi:hypothetical protein